MRHLRRNQRNGSRQESVEHKTFLHGRSKPSIQRREELLDAEGHVRKHQAIPRRR